MGHIIAIANQKGGVAKTTTAVNLAAGLIRCGKSVLLIDLDPQANASESIPLSEDDDPASLSIYEVLTGENTLAEARRKVVLSLDFVPSHIKLAKLEPTLTGALEAYKLRDVLDGIAYDYVILDCPPSLGPLTTNALVAATDVVVPVRPAFYGLHAVRDFMDTVKAIKQRLNPKLNVLGILITMHDARTTMAKDVMNALREMHTDLIFKTTIGVNVKLDEAASARKSIFLFDNESRGAKDYEAFVAEVIDRAEA